ncbi:MAG: 3'-5' exonuclease [Tenuifilaceae bacterium]|jgi:DNA polymerase elongation subunit (family B)|nr:3'-5' exonuclease [Tenuifilaceae bacterium]
MLDQVRNEDILFLDIETVPQHASFSEVPEGLKTLWEKKAAKIADNNQNPEEIYNRAGIYAEFGKIICISVGLIVNKSGQPFFRVKSFAGHNEAELLLEFADMLEKFAAKPQANLCAHNGKEFDFPYIARRMLVNGINIPSILDVAGKKPWEVRFLDTMELWKFGDYKHYTSLNLLTQIFNIPTPKDDIDGSQVADVYYRENDLNRIVTYCEKDVLAVAQLFLRYKNQPLIPHANIEVAG